MTGHLLVPAVDPELPATLSRSRPDRTAARRARLRGRDRHRRHRDARGRRPVRLRRAPSSRALAAGADAICVGGEHADEGTADAAARRHRGRRDRPASSPRSGWPRPPSGSRAWPPGPRPRGAGAAPAPWHRRPARRSVWPRPAARCGSGGDGPALPLAAAAARGRVVAADEHRHRHRARPGASPRRWPRCCPARRGAADERPTAEAAALAAAAAGRPLVLVVRDLHRHAWMGALVRARWRPARTRSWSSWACPAAVVGATHIATHGATRSSGLAAAERPRGPIGVSTHFGLAE